MFGSSSPAFLQQIRDEFEEFVRQEKLKAANLPQVHWFANTYIRMIVGDNLWNIYTVFATFASRWLYTSRYYSYTLQNDDIIYFIMMVYDLNWVLGTHNIESWTEDYYEFDSELEFIWMEIFSVMTLSGLKITFNLDTKPFIFSEIELNPEKIVLFKAKIILKVNTYVNIIFCYASIFYNLIKRFIVALSVVIILSLILWDYYNDDIDTMVGIWLIVGFLVFWLFSGFNFFLKRYRFGKFTSAIQRFWKRTNTYFWLIEGFLFSLFFYYYLNSSQEPLYFYDESNLNQEHLLSLMTNYYSMLLLVFIIFYSFYVLLNLVNFTFRQTLVHLTLISLLFIYIFLLECYQFYYVITLFYENTYNFQPSSNSWILDTDSPRIRVKLQYLILGLIAKYWHFLFIFFFWLFMIYKFYEKKKISYVLFGAAVQNFLILFGLNILFNIYWIKWVIKRFYDIVYYWFFTDTNTVTIINFFSELYLFIMSCISI